MKLVAYIIILALVLAWSIVITALLMGHDGAIAGAGIAGIVTLGEISRLIIKAVTKSSTLKQIDGMTFKRGENDDL